MQEMSEQTYKKIIPKSKIHTASHFEAKKTSRKKQKAKQIDKFEENQEIAEDKENSQCRETIGREQTLINVLKTELIIGRLRIQEIIEQISERILIRKKINKYKIQILQSQRNFENISVHCRQKQAQFNQFFSEFQGEQQLLQAITSQEQKIMSLTHQNSTKKETIRNLQNLISHQKQEQRILINRRNEINGSIAELSQKFNYPQLLFENLIINQQLNAHKKIYSLQAMIPFCLSSKIQNMEFQMEPSLYLACEIFIKVKISAISLSYLNKLSYFCEEVRQVFQFKTFTTIFNEKNEEKPIRPSQKNIVLFLNKNCQCSHSQNMQTRQKIENMLRSVGIRVENKSTDDKCELLLI